jgi:copper oxidase (laccase) domain-containing protein
MGNELPGPGQGGFADIALEGTDYTARVRGKCGPGHRELDGVTFLEQVHGTSILHSPGTGDEGDGMVFPAGTGYPGLRVADCLPLFVVTGRSLAAAHCGWKGIAGGIVYALLDSLPDTPRHVFLGPRICAGCYHVGEEVREKVAGADPEGVRGHPDGSLDLGLTVSRQLAAWLRSAGTDPASVALTDAGFCTCCLPGHFHSWRGSGDTGRNLVWLSDSGSIADGADQMQYSMSATFSGNTQTGHRCTPEGE